MFSLLSIFGYLVEFLVFLKIEMFNKQRKQTLVLKGSL
jgi:hypothetical protein